MTWRHAPRHHSEATVGVLTRSEDGGRNWTPARPLFVRLSVDDGKSWSRLVRISPASAMVGMTETTDGRVFIAMHEGYRVPGYIRSQFFRVTSEGPVPVG